MIDKLIQVIGNILNKLSVGYVVAVKNRLFKQTTSNNLH